VISGGVGVSGGVVSGGEAAAGFALAEGGGVVASARIVATAQAEASVQLARASFEVPVVSVEARVQASGPGFSVSSGASGAVTSGAVVGVRVPPPDPRTQTYGQGIPLRAQITLG
jgi:hypothetical protein